MPDPVRVALYDLLAADAVIAALASGVYFRRPSTATPYVIFQQQSGVNYGTFGGEGVDNEVWLVKGVSGDPEQAEDLDRAAKRTLHRATMPVPGHMALFRITDVQYDEVTDGENFHHIGGEYRLMTEEESA